MDYPAANREVSDKYLISLTSKQASRNLPEVIKIKWMAIRNVVEA